ncbi:ribonuclease P protein component [Corynebacterium choanae]|uniref:Ribonuclease P protein component n=1 Tax=Corynebacterium choanae TaxID=1862358 RepID=A0A3G6JDJ4_9CORY|nr:ribonuclease P protein component [Corynebacterium choanae]AZA14740.1 ribonuclease P [Corynebacterium choanae]
MLPQHHKLTQSRQFQQVIRRGKRAGTPHLVVYVCPHRLPAAVAAYQRQQQHDAATPAAAADTDLSAAQLLRQVERLSTAELTTSRTTRIGLVVGKAVGNAVTRHRVSRQLRDISRELCTTFDQPVDIVIRALAGAAELSYDELHATVFRCAQKAYRRGR